MTETTPTEAYLTVCQGVREIKKASKEWRDCLMDNMEKATEPEQDALLVKILVAQKYIEGLAK